MHGYRDEQNVSHREELLTHVVDFLDFAVVQLPREDCVDIPLYGKRLKYCGNVK